MDIWRDKRFVFKNIGFLLVMAGTTGVTSADYEMGHSEYGVTAAVYAMGAAALLVLSLIPTKWRIGRVPYDALFHLSGGALAITAAVFWLLDETNGNLRPYLWPVLLNGGTLLITWVVLMSVSTMARIDDQRRARESKQEDE